MLALTDAPCAICFVTVRAAAPLLDVVGDWGGETVTCKNHVTRISESLLLQ